MPNDIVRIKLLLAYTKIMLIIKNYNFNNGLVLFIMI